MKKQLDRQGTKCFWPGPVGQQKSAQRHKAIPPGPDSLLARAVSQNHDCTLRRDSS
jgi:hypothetical protein